MSTYATYYIKRNIRFAIANQGRVVRIPDHVAVMINKMKRLNEVAVQNTEENMGAEELSEAMGVPGKVVELAQRLQGESFISLKPPFMKERIGVQYIMLKKITLLLPLTLLLQQSKESYSKKFSIVKSR